MDPAGVRSPAGGGEPLSFAGQRLEAQPREPAEWREAAWFGDRIMYLTAEEMAELGSKVEEMVDVYFERRSARCSAA